MVWRHGMCCHGSFVIFLIFFGRDVRSSIILFAGPDLWIKPSCTCILCPCRPMIYRTCIFEPVVLLCFKLLSLSIALFCLVFRYWVLFLRCRAETVCRASLCMVKQNFWGFLWSIPKFFVIMGLTFLHHYCGVMVYLDTLVGRHCRATAVNRRESLQAFHFLQAYHFSCLSLLQVASGWHCARIHSQLLMDRISIGLKVVGALLDGFSRVYPISSASAWVAIIASLPTSGLLATYEYICLR